MSVGEDIDTGDVSGAARTPCFGESAAEGGGGVVRIALSCLSQDGSLASPLVNIQKAIENGHL